MGEQTRGVDFDRFVGDAAPGLLRTALLLTGERGAAEDLLQDVLERLYVAWPRVRDPLPYARRSLVHGAANRRRSRARRPETALAGHDVAVADPTDRSGERDRVLRALAQLPPRQRAVVVLRWFEDLGERDTADALGCSVGTVKSQGSRALARLRVLLDDEVDDAHPVGGAGVEGTR